MKLINDTEYKQLYSEFEEITNNRTPVQDIIKTIFSISM